MARLAQGEQRRVDGFGALGGGAAVGEGEGALGVVEGPVRDVAEDRGDGGEEVAECVVVALDAEGVVGGDAGGVEGGVGLVVGEAGVGS